MAFSGVQVLGKELRRDPDRALRELQARSAAAARAGAAAQGFAGRAAKRLGLGARGAVLGQVAARLAHVPDGRAGDGFALERAQQQIVHVSPGNPR